MRNNAGEYSIAVTYLRVCKGIPYIGRAAYAYDREWESFSTEQEPTVEAQHEWHRHLTAHNVIKYILEKMPRECWRRIGVDPHNPYNDILCKMVQEEYDNNPEAYTKRWWG